MKDTRLITMIEGAIIAGVCVALSFIPLNTANAAFDLSLGLIPLGVYALRRGLLPGMAAGFVWGLLLIVLGKAFILTIPQVVLEYPLAFAFGGLGGVFAGRLRRFLSEAESSLGERVRDGRAMRAPTGSGWRGAITTVIFAGIVAAAARWFFHFWAGVIFWGSYAPEGMSPYLYSFIMNGSSAAANAIMVAVILSILVKTAKTLFVYKQ